MGEDWGKELTRIIAATELRVANYKRLVADAHKNGDRELIDLFKGFQKDEEKWLKRRRREKQLWNEGIWEQILLEKVREEEDPNPARAGR